MAVNTKLHCQRNIRTKLAIDKNDFDHDAADGTKRPTPACLTSVPSTVKSVDSSNVTTLVKLTSTEANEE